MILNPPNSRTQAEIQRDDNLRREALEQAVKYASAPQVSSTTAAIVGTAKDFYAFLTEADKPQEQAE